MGKPMVSAHYISGTHWDREWYRPFQEYRLLLVRLIDELLEIMEEDGAFRYFQLDGQTCVLDDYLEIRPENRGRLERLIQSGRLLIGPWYTMPDLFCPDGESLVRNLQLGRRIAGEWGAAPMPVGFICDMFGHPSQMPQLFAGFGIGDIVLGRGTNEHSTEMFFDWASPDGTVGLVYKLQDTMGYGAFALPRAIIEASSEEAANQLPERDQFVAELQAARGDAGQERAVRERWGGQALARYVDYEVKRANLPVMAVMDSMDHVPPARDVGRYLRLVGEFCPAVEPRHSTLPAFFAEVRQRRGRKRLAVKRGELREPSREQCGYLWLIPNCVSARIGLKLAGDAAAGLLERWVEPLLAVAGSGSAIGRELLPYLRVAWRQVLANHAHDSVCGCSIDQVHRDMMYRFDQARTVGEQVRHQLFAALTANCAELGTAADEFTVTLFNPLPVERDEVVTFDIDLPVDYPTTFKDGFRSQVLKSFTLTDIDGQPLPYQRLGCVPNMGERSRVAKYCFIGNGNFARYGVAARVKLPAFGFTSLLVKPSARPVRPVGSLRSGPAAAANEHLAIELQSNGALTLVDRATGQVYRDLLTFEDRSEIGDGWFHGQSLNDAPRLSTGCQARLSVVHDGPEMVTFRSEVDLAVPASYDWHAERPAEQVATVTIASDISLRRGARLVEIKTVVDNAAADHRLQLLLPSDTTADVYLAHTAFDLVERPIALDAATADWQEMDIVEKPFESLQAVGDGSRGLAFVAAGGLHEGGVRDDLRRTLQVTLLRSFRRTVGTEGERDGLELGRREYHYGIMPFAGPLPAAAALREALQLQAGLLTRQSGKRPSGYPPLAGTARAVRSFLAQRDGTLLLSALKPAEDGIGLVVRLWNPTGQTATETLVFDQSVATVGYCRLDETAVAGAKAPRIVARRQVRIEAAARQIVCLRVTFAEGG